MVKNRCSLRGMKMISMKSIAGWNGGNSCDSYDWEIFDDQILCEFLKVKVTFVLCKEICTPEVSQFSDFV